MTLSKNYNVHVPLLPSFPRFHICGSVAETEIVLIFIPLLVSSILSYWWRLGFSGPSFFLYSSAASPKLSSLIRIQSKHIAQTTLRYTPEQMEKSVHRIFLMISNKSENERLFEYLWRKSNATEAITKRPSETIPIQIIYVHFFFVIEVL